MMKNRLLIAAALALTLLGGRAARAGIVFDSLTGVTTAGYLSISSTGPLGDSFSTGTASTLSDVKVNLFNPSTSTAGSIIVSLHSDAGNTPGALIATLGTVSTSSITPGTAAVEDFSGFSPTIMLANTRYWIELTSSGSDLEWGITGTITGPGVMNEYDYFLGTAQSNVVSAGVFEMQVSVTPTAVPEPSSLVLCAIAGLGGLGFVARRRASAV